MGTARHHNGPDRNPGESGQNGVFSWFCRIENRRTAPAELLRRWDEMARYPWAPHRLCVILRNTAKAVKRMPHGERRTDLIASLAENMPAWEKKALPALPAFQHRDLQDALWAHAALGIRPSDGFLKAWEERAIDLLPSSDHMNLALYLWAHASLALSPSAAFMDAWKKQADNILTQGASQPLHGFNVRDHFSILWSLAVLHVLSGDPALEKLAARIEDALPDDMNTISDMQQHVSVCAWFGWRANRQALSRGDTKSSTEQKLSDLFARAGYDPRRASNRTIPVIGHRPDISLADRGTVFHIEVDGPTHFLWNHEGRVAGYNGNTLLQSALIRKLAPEAVLIRLRLPEGSLFLDERQSEDTLEVLVETARAMGPDAYETFTRDDGSVGLRDHLPRREPPPAPGPAPAP